MESPPSATQPNQETPALDPATQAIADGWIKNEIDSATAITDPDHPFFVHSNNSSTFKYKYPEAKPTPPGEDDAVWNKTYTAADSRMYNKNGKDHNNSRKIRASGETYTLCLQIHWENKQKFAKKHANPLDPNSILVGKAPPKPKPASTKPSHSTTMESASRRENSMDGIDLTPMSISEKIKSKEGKRKASSAAALAIQRSSPPVTSQSVAGLPFANPSSTQTKSNSTPDAGSPPSPKVEKAKTKPRPKKKPKKATPADGASNVSAGTQPSTVRASSAAQASNDSDSESNDGGVYCICGGPDDHRMMVFCEGPCHDWYHCQCIKLDQADTAELLDRFICSKCTTETMFTTWKRMCRNWNIDRNHRRAARVNELSKYCSDKCLVDFWKFVYNKFRDDNEPSKGGALNQEEVGMLLHAVGNAAGLHALGKKPTLPVEPGRDPDRPKGLDYVTDEEQKELDEIHAKLAEFDHRIGIRHKQLKLVAMAADRSKAAAKHPSLETPNICGYDTRLAVNEYEFERWFKSEEGQQAFSTGKLGPRTAETKAIGAITPFPGQVIPPVPQVPDAVSGICLNKSKGCRHKNWVAITNQDLSQELFQLRSELKMLKDKQAEIIEDAETREATKTYYAHNKTTQLF